MTKQYKQPEEVKIEEPKMNEPMFLSEVLGIYETVTAAPIRNRTNIINQIKIYTNGATLRLYWYDALNDTWHYVTATA